ncbi:hypothetical protein ACFE04_029545 [Oxalis oulophora]
MKKGVGVRVFKWNQTLPVTPPDQGVMMIQLTVNLRVLDTKVFKFRLEDLSPARRSELSRTSDQKIVIVAEISSLPNLASRSTARLLTYVQLEDESKLKDNICTICLEDLSKVATSYPTCLQNIGRSVLIVNSRSYDFGEICVITGRTTPLCSPALSKFEFQDVRKLCCRTIWALSSQSMKFMALSIRDSEAIMHPLMLEMRKFLETILLRPSSESDDNCLALVICAEVQVKDLPVNKTGVLVKDSSLENVVSSSSVLSYVIHRLIDNKIKLVPLSFCLCMAIRLSLALARRFPQSARSDLPEMPFRAGVKLMASLMASEDEILKCISSKLPEAQSVPLRVSSSDLSPNLREMCQQLNELRVQIDYLRLISCLIHSLLAVAVRTSLPQFIPDKCLSQESDLIFETCVRTTFQQFCESQLEHHGGSKATNLHSLAALTLKLANSQILSIQKDLKKYASQDPSAPDGTEANQCLKMYNVAVLRVRYSITALGHKRYDNVTAFINSAITDTTKCEEVYRNFVPTVVHEPSEVFKKTCYTELSILFLLKGN